MADYTVTFDSAGGTSVVPQTVASGGLVIKPTDPTRSGWDFVGWYDGSTSWTFATDTVSDNMTLTANWSMVESVFAGVYDNIVDTLNGAVIVYDNDDKVLTCEAQRLYADFRDDFPYVEVQFVGSEVVQASAYSYTEVATFMVLCHVGDINDEYPNDPIGAVLRNVNAHIIKHIMTDQTRGGNAMTTDIEAYGQETFDYSSGISSNASRVIDHVCWIQIQCRYMVAIADPFTRNG